MELIQKHVDGRGGSITIRIHPKHSEGQRFYGRHALRQHLIAREDDVDDDDNDGDDMFTGTDENIRLS